MTRARVAGTALVAAVWLWLVGVVLTPGVVFPLGQFICHQRPERSFFFHGRQLAVCARCTGLYAGAAVAAPLALVAASGLASRRARVVLAVAAVPTLITWSLEFAGLVPFSNWPRFVAALPLGFAAAWVVFSTLADAAPSRVEPITR